MKNLKVVMAQKNMTARKLSQITGIAEQTISGYRNNKGNPTLSTMKQIAEALGVEVKELV